MRFLHSENCRFHGRLTSHNCVIDSRWVLKITDYSLSLFYQAQGVEINLQRDGKGYKLYSNRRILTEITKSTETVFRLRT